MTLAWNNLPERIRKKIERRAQAENVSFDDAAVHMLDDAPEASNANNEKVIGTGLDWFFGSGALEPAVLKAIAEHDVVVPDEQP